jgi:hypothetical protein
VSVSPSPSVRSSAARVAVYRLSSCQSSSPRRREASGLPRHRRAAAVFLSPRRSSHGRVGPPSFGRTATEMGIPSVRHPESYTY